MFRRENHKEAYELPVSACGCCCALLALVWYRAQGHILLVECCLDVLMRVHLGLTRVFGAHMVLGGARGTQWRELTNEGALRHDHG